MLVYLQPGGIRCSSGIPRSIPRMEILLRTLDLYDVLPRGCFCIRCSIIPSRCSYLILVLAQHRPLVNPPRFPNLIVRLR